MVSASLDANFAAQNVNASVEVNYDLGDTSFLFPPPETLSSTSGIISSSDRKFLILHSIPHIFDAMLFLFLFN